MHNATEKVFELQNRFISHILDDIASIDARQEKGLEIYRENLYSTATQSLSLTYPTVVNLVGEDLMRHIAIMLLKKQPPFQGDWAQWGVGLPNFLQKIPALDEYPFVGDAAKLDLAIHQSERAPNQSFNHDSVHRLAEYSLDKLTITLNSAVHFFNSPFPIIEIRNVDTDGNSTSLTRLENRINSNNASQNVLIYRPQFKALTKEISAAELDWLTLIAKQVSLGDALDAIDNDAFDFAHWLPAAIKQNLITDLVVTYP